VVFKVGFQFFVRVTKIWRFLILEFFNTIGAKGTSENSSWTNFFVGDYGCLPFIKPYFNWH